MAADAVMTSVVVARETLTGAVVAEAVAVASVETDMAIAIVVMVAVTVAAVTAAGLGVTDMGATTTADGRGRIVAAI